MNYQYLNIAGLLFDLAGVFVLFEFGLPSKVQESGGSITIEETGESELKREKFNKRIKKFSRLGLVLICIGFLLQICSSIASFSNTNPSPDKNPKSDYQNKCNK